MIKIYVLVIFFIVYFLVLLRRFNPLISLYLGIGSLLIIGAITFRDSLQFINYNVLGVFLGTMVLGNLFIYSKTPRFLAEKILSKSKNVGIAFVFICALTAFISSFLENVSTILIVAPLAIELARKLKVSPVPLLIGMAISSNLEGCATLIGDSPSIILAFESGMNFNDFFVMQGRPSIFFAVQIGALFALTFLYFKYKGYKEHIPEKEITKPITLVPTFLLLGMIATLIVSSFIQEKPSYILSLICLSWAFVGLTWFYFIEKQRFNWRKDIDWHTFFFLVGIFILVGGLSSSGVLLDFANYISKVSAKSILTAYIIIVVFSVFVSAFVDNIPYTIAMIPVAKSVALSLGANPFLLLFGLLIGSCLGGNITPIGASCNIVGMGILRKEGYQVSFKEFFALGFPFTILAVTAASIFIWIIFGG